MHWLVFARCAATAVIMAAVLSAQPNALRAAEPDGVKSEGATSDRTQPGDQAITFEEYRNWRLAAMERRRSEIDVQLSAADLPERRKARLQDTRAYYNWLAGLSETERDRRFRERFDRIDANHDGSIDPAERTAWRDKQRTFYHRDRPVRQPAAAETR